MSVETDIHESKSFAKLVEQCPQLAQEGMRALIREEAERNPGEDWLDPETVMRILVLRTTQFNTIVAMVGHLVKEEAPTIEDEDKESTKMVILGLIRNKGSKGVTTATLCKATGKARTSVRRTLRILQNENLIWREGEGNSTIYLPSVPLGGT